MAIVSLVGPTLTNAFSVDRKKNWFEHCRLECRPLYYGRHVDDIFVLFSLPERLKRVIVTKNSCQLNIYFTLENEKDKRMSFPDVNIICEKDKFTTSDYC